MADLISLSMAEEPLAEPLQSWVQKLTLTTALCYILLQVAVKAPCLAFDMAGLVSIA